MSRTKKPVFAGVLIWDSERDQVLSCSRKNNLSDWGLPSGKIEKGEPTVPAALRELLEETGLILPPHLLNLSPEFQYQGYCDHAEGEGVFFFIPLSASALATVNSRLPTFGKGVWSFPGEGQVAWKSTRDLLKIGNTFREFNRSLFEHFKIIDPPAPEVCRYTVTVPPEHIVADLGSREDLLRLMEFMREESRIHLQDVEGDRLQQILGRESDYSVTLNDLLWEVWNSPRGWRLYQNLRNPARIVFEVHPDCTLEQTMDLFERFIEILRTLLSDPTP